MAPDPLVTVVVPVYNCERFLGQALDSLLAQDYEPLEIVVVDDGSTDGSAAVAKARSVRYLKTAHGGVSAARNAGVAEARGELIAFLDADDFWTPDAVTKQAAYLRDHPELGFVVPMMLFFVEPGSSPPPWYKAEWESEPNVSHLPMARRQTLQQVGPYDRSYEIGEDLDWVARAKDLGVRHEVVPDVLRHYRMHGANATYSMRGPEHVFRVVRKTIARQRAASG